MSVPHTAHTVRVSGRARDDLAARFALHSLQCLGSLVKFLAWKNSCSSAVKMNSLPQTTHFKTLSVSTFSGFLIQARPEAANSFEHSLHWNAENALAQLEKPIARITFVNSRLGPEPHQISSGEFKGCAEHRQP